MPLTQRRRRTLVHHRRCSQTDLDLDFVSCVFHTVFDIFLGMGSRSLNLLGFAFHLIPSVAGHFADSVLDFAFDIFGSCFCSFF